MTVFAEDQTGCISHCIVEVVSQRLYVVSSSSPSHDHFLCLHHESFESLQYLCLTRIAVSTKCNRSDCDADHSESTTSISWMLCEQTPGATASFFGSCIAESPADVLPVL